MNALAFPMPEGMRWSFDSCFGKKRSPARASACALKLKGKTRFSSYGSVTTSPVPIHKLPMTSPGPTLYIRSCLGILGEGLGGISARTPLVQSRLMVSNKQRDEGFNSRLSPDRRWQIISHRWRF